MTERERVIAAIQHRETDYVPYHLRFTAEERAKFVAATGIPDPENHYGNHIDLATCMDFATEPEKGLFRDEFGVVWDRRDGADIGMPVEWLLKKPDLTGFAFPSPVGSEIDKQMAALTSGPWNTFRAVTVGFTLYERAWSMRGIENLLMDMLQEEDFVGELFDRIVEYDIRAMERVLEASTDFDAFYFGDDWGQQTGLIMSARLWKKLIGPRVAKLLAFSKKHGKYTIFHSCGKIIDLFPFLIEAGLDVYDTFQPEIYDIVQVKRKFGDKLTFLGGISTQVLLPYASPKVVESTTREIIGIMGKNGGYIAAPTHAVPPDVSTANLLAMIGAFRERQKPLA